MVKVSVTPALLKNTTRSLEAEGAFIYCYILSHGTIDTCWIKGEPIVNSNQSRGTPMPDRARSALELVVAHQHRPAKELTHVGTGTT